MKLYYTSLAAILVCSCATAAFADDATCIANATTSGSFFSGHKYDVSDEFPDASTDATFKRLDLAVVHDGWRISQADREMGIISASEGALESRGNQPTLNITIEASGAKGSKATATLQLGPGQIGMSSPSKFLCGLITGTLAPD